MRKTNYTLCNVKKNLSVYKYQAQTIYNKKEMNFLLEAFNNARSGDEYYTRYRDIEKELSNYNFSRMIVYCNCDNPESSSFVKYFKDNFENLGLKCLLATFVGAQPMLYRYDGVQATTKPLSSGRFQDNKGIVSMCDIVVTNPPFSNQAPVELIKIVTSLGIKYVIFSKKSYMRCIQNNFPNMS